MLRSALRGPLRLDSASMANRPRMTLRQTYVAAAHRNRGNCCRLRCSIDPRRVGVWMTFTPLSSGAATGSSARPWLRLPPAQERVGSRRPEAPLPAAKVCHRPNSSRLNMVPCSIIAGICSRERCTELLARHVPDPPVVARLRLSEGRSRQPDNRHLGKRDQGAGNWHRPWRDTAEVSTGQAPALSGCFAIPTAASPTTAGTVVASTMVRPGIAAVKLPG
jgi:hypothetical protein